MTGNDVRGLLISVFDKPAEDPQAKQATIELIAGLFDMLDNIVFLLRNLDERDQNRAMRGD